MRLFRNFREGFGGAGFGLGVEGFIPHLICGVSKSIGVIKNLSF